MHYYQALSAYIATFIVAGGFLYSQDEFKTDLLTFLGFCVGTLIMWPLVYALWPMFFIAPCVRIVWPKGGISGFLSRSQKSDS